MVVVFFFSSRRRHTRCALVTGVQTCALPICEIPGFPYDLLWGERQIMSVANLTRQDGLDFLGLAPRIGIVTHTNRYRLDQANQALSDLRAGRFEGAARSEEHTSELQSLMRSSYAVFCLKKKNTQ